MSPSPLRFGPALIEVIRVYNPVYRIANKLRMREAAAFDRRYRVDTERPVFVDELRIPVRSAGDARYYAATPVRDFRRLVRKSGVTAERFTFVDLGCGKGRVLMLASEAGFRRIIGVEADPHLCEIAKANARRWREHHAGSAPIEVINADARDYDFPPDDLFVYLFNPFDGEVLDDVARHLALASEATGRALVIAYFNNLGVDRMDAVQRFTREDLRPLLPWRRSTVSYHRAVNRPEEQST